MSDTQPINLSFGTARLLTRAQLAESALWKSAFAARCKDHRYYELLDDEVRQNFDYAYLQIKDRSGVERAIQPIFWVKQDIVAASFLQKIVAPLRRIFPNLFIMKMLMAGCAAGVGQLGVADENNGDETAVSEALREALAISGKKSGAWLTLMKDFQVANRQRLSSFTKHGFSRLASMPMTRLRLDFDDFDDYLQKRLSKVTRKSLRRKLRKSDDANLTMEVVSDITPFIDEVFPLYLAVHEKSSLKFETLTPEFLCRLGREMPDRARFFIWRLAGKIVAFSVCLVHDGAIYDEYLGLDYSVALDLHLYFVTIRDVLVWALAQKLAWYYSSPLNYDPKLHLGLELEPLDIYVVHARAPLSFIFRSRFLRRFIEPTHSDPAIAKFPNAQELYA